MRRPRRRLPLPFFLAALAVCARGEPRWPCYHGPNRDNRSADTGLLASWPAEGPKLLWTASGLGEGYSSAAIAGGRLYTAGMIEKQTHVIALDMDGKVLWRTPNGPSWAASREQQWAVAYAGARGTPAVDGDLVYHMADMGDLRAFDARTGEVKWHVDLLRVFEGERPKYGLSESVLLDGDALLCCPGGAKGYMAALDTRTGATLWANTELRDPVGYCSPVIAEIDGVRQAISMSAARVFAVDPAGGSLLWQHEFGNPRQNSATDVIVHDNAVYASCGYRGGSVLLRPRRQAGGRHVVEQVWRVPALDNHHGGVVRDGDFLYGAGHEARGWFCLDFKSGATRWQSPGKGSLTYADGRLYLLDENGTMALVRCTPEKWEAVSSFKLPRGGKGLYWAHPVVCGGRLYVRHADQLFAYDVRAE